MNSIELSILGFILGFIIGSALGASFMLILIDKRIRGK